MSPIASRPARPPRDRSGLATARRWHRPGQSTLEPSSTGSVIESYRRSSVRPSSTALDTGSFRNNDLRADSRPRCPGSSACCRAGPAAVSIVTKRGVEPDDYDSDSWESRRPKAQRVRGGLRAARAAGSGRRGYPLVTARIAGDRRGDRWRKINGDGIKIKHTDIGNGWLELAAICLKIPPAGTPGGIGNGSEIDEAWARRTGLKAMMWLERCQRSRGPDEELAVAPTTGQDWSLRAKPMCRSWNSPVRSVRPSPALPRSRNYPRSSACQWKPLRPALAGSTLAAPRQRLTPCA